MDSTVQDVLETLERRGTQHWRDAMRRYGVHTDKAFGVSIGTLKQMAKRLGRNHELSLALWDTGWYDARILAVFIGESERVSAAQMERWRSDFDNWAIVDTVCFHLFDRTKYAWNKVAQWTQQRDEYGKRAAFALLWSLTVHDKSADDKHFLRGLRLIERAASDDRHYVKKGVNMALRAIGKRNPKLYAAAMGTAKRLSVSPHASAQWVGKDALRELSSRSVTRRVG